MSLEVERQQAMEWHGVGPEGLEDYLESIGVNPEIVTPLGNAMTSQAVELDLDAEFEAHCVDFGD
jgi:hypothetical protein